MRFTKLALPLYLGLTLTFSCGAVAQSFDNTENLNPAGSVQTANLLHSAMKPAQNSGDEPGSVEGWATLSNFNEITTGWLLCTGSCAGGTNPSAEIQQFHITTPSLDNQSMRIALTGPTTCPAPCNTGPNNGWYYNTGKDDTHTSFSLNFEFNAPSNAQVVSREFDQFQYLLAGDGGVTSNTRLYFGTQCVTGGDWDVWNSYGNGNWVDTGVKCNYTVSSTAFNHLIINVHRVSGDTSCTGGYPCMYYDSIILNNTTVVSNVKTSAGALPAGWGEQTGFMLQLDGKTTCLSTCTINEYVDEGSFTY